MNADFLSRLPQPAAEHHRSGYSRLTHVVHDDETIHLVKACDLHNPFTPVPGIALGGLISQPDSEVWVGRCDFARRFASCLRPHF